MVQVVSRQSVGPEVSGSIPGASHLLGCGSYPSPPMQERGWTTDRVGRSLEEEKELSYKEAPIARCRKE